jgi:choline dehydrogenase-like flavoprotein
MRILFIFLFFISSQVFSQNFDIDFLKEYSNQLLGQVRTVQAAIFSDAGTVFNIASAQQVGNILFEQLKLSDKPKKTKTGQYQTDEELVKAAGDIGTTIFHPVGTCKMGRADDPMAVLDSELRVRGIHHLRVVDASAMPTITSGNTAAPTMMIAQRAAELLVNRSKG